MDEVGDRPRSSSQMSKVAPMWCIIRESEGEREREREREGGGGGKTHPIQNGQPKQSNFGQNFGDYVFLVLKYRKYVYFK